MYLILVFTPNVEPKLKKENGKRKGLTQTPVLKIHQFADFKSKNGIIHSNTQTLINLKTIYDYVVVLFGAHACSDCARLLLRIEKLVPEVHNKGILIPFAYMICEAADPHCEQAENVLNPPVLRIYHKNMFVEYNDIKNVDHCARWIKDRLVHNLQEGTGQAKNIKATSNQSEVVVVLKEDQTFKGFNEFKMLTIFYEFAHFFYTKDDKTLAELEKSCQDRINETPDSVLYLINPENSNCYYYNGPFNYKRAMNFIVEHDKIPVSMFDENILKLQQKYQIPITIFFTKDALNHPFYLQYFKIAEKFKNKMVFTYVDNTNLKDPLVHKMMNIFGVDRKSFPTICVFFRKANGIISKWKYNKKMDSLKFRTFVVDLLNRKIKTYNKSESLKRIAYENEKSIVEKVSANNFPRKIEEETDPILLLIEGSEETCQNCSNLQQKMVEIKNKFIERQGSFPYHMYRLNIQLNEIKNWVFDKVPQLVFIRKNKKLVIYNDEIETNKVIEFIEDHLSPDSRESWREDL